MQEKSEVPTQVSCNKEVLANMLMTLLAQLLRDLRMRQQITNLIRRTLDRMGQQTGLPMDDLQRYTSDG